MTISKVLARVLWWCGTAGLALAWAFSWQELGDADTTAGNMGLMALPLVCLASAGWLGFRYGIVTVLTVALWVALVGGAVNLAAHGDRRSDRRPECPSATNGGLGTWCRTSALEQSISGGWPGLAVAFVGGLAAGFGTERRRVNR